MHFFIMLTAALYVASKDVARVIPRPRDGLPNYFEDISSSKINIWSPLDGF